MVWCCYILMTFWPQHEPPPHTHTHRHTFTRSHTHTHTHIYTLTRSHTHTHTHTLTHTLTHTHTHTQTQTHIYTLTYTHTHSLTHTHTHSHTHTHVCFGENLYRRLRYILHILAFTKFKSGLLFRRTAAFVKYFCISTSSPLTQKCLNALRRFWKWWEAHILWLYPFIKPSCWFRPAEAELVWWGWWPCGQCFVNNLRWSTDKAQRMKPLQIHRKSGDLTG